MKIENMKLFTEYERQFKRKYPGCKCKICYEHDDVRFDFEILNNVTLYDFSLTSTAAKNGDYPCTLHCWAKNISDFNFTESRKPMEMNIDNAVNIGRAMLYRCEEIEKDIERAKSSLNDKEWFGFVEKDIKETKILKDFCDAFNIKQTPEFLQQCVDGFAVFHAFHVGNRMAKNLVERKVNSYGLHHTFDDIYEKLTGVKHYVPTEAVAASYAAYLTFCNKDWKDFITKNGPNFDLTIDEYFDDMTNQF